MMSRGHGRSGIQHLYASAHHLLAHRDHWRYGIQTEYAPVCELFCPRTKRRATSKNESSWDTLLSQDHSTLATHVWNVLTHLRAGGAMDTTLPNVHSPLPHLIFRPGHGRNDTHSSYARSNSFAVKPRIMRNPRIARLTAFSVPGSGPLRYPYRWRPGTPSAPEPKNTRYPRLLHSGAPSVAPDQSRHENHSWNVRRHIHLCSVTRSAMIDCPSNRRTP